MQTVHRSYAIAVDQIGTIEKDSVVLLSQRIELPVSKKHYPLLMKSFNIVEAPLPDTGNEITGSNKGSGSRQSAVGRFSERRCGATSPDTPSGCSGNLLNKNPLEYVRNTRSIEGVLLKGEWIDGNKIDTMLKKVEVAFK